MMSFALLSVAGAACSDDDGGAGGSGGDAAASSDSDSDSTVRAGGDGDDDGTAGDGQIDGEPGDESDGGDDGDAGGDEGDDGGEVTPVDAMLDGIVAQLESQGFVEELPSDEEEDETVGSDECQAINEVLNGEVLGDGQESRSLSQGALESGGVEEIELSAAIAEPDDIDAFFAAFEDDDLETCVADGITEVFSRELASEDGVELGDVSVEELPDADVGDGYAGFAITTGISAGGIDLPIGATFQVARSGRAVVGVSSFTTGTTDSTVDVTALLETMIARLGATAG